MSLLLTRRRLLGAGAGLGAGLLLGCANDDPPAPSGGGGVAAGAFPVTVGTRTARPSSRRSRSGW